MTKDKYLANEVISYDFRKGSLVDQTGTNNITSVTGSYLTKTPARSLYFDGATYIASSGSNVGLTGNQSMTVSVLIDNKNNGNGNNKRIFRLGNTSANAMFSGNVNTNGTILLDNWGGNLSTTDTIENERVHLTFKYDGANRYIYINGSLSASGAYSALMLTDAVMYLGAKSAGADSWKGNIQAITVYNTSISAEDVAKIAEEELTTKPYNVVDFKSDGRYYIADGKGWNESKANVTAGFLENTGFDINGGTWKVTDYDGFDKCLEAQANNAYLNKPCNQVYGTWEFEAWRTNDSSVMYIGLIGDKVGANVGYDGYQILLTNFGGTARAVALRRATTSSAVTLFVSEAEVVADATWNKFRVTRDTAGIFKIYMQGPSDADYVLLTATAGTTNPVTDNTYTNCTHNNIDFDTSNKVRNFRFIPYIE